MLDEGLISTLRWLGKGLSILGGHSGKREPRAVGASITPPIVVVDIELGRRRHP